MALLPVRCSQQELQPPQVVSTADACDPFHGCGVGSRLEAALHARRNSTSTATQTLYTIRPLCLLSRPLCTCGAVRLLQQVGPAAAAACAGLSRPQTCHLLQPNHAVYNLQRTTLMISSCGSNSCCSTSRSNSIIISSCLTCSASWHLLNGSCPVPAAALSHRRRQSGSNVQQEVHAAAAAAAAADIHRAGLDAILQRLGSWDADVLAEVHRNGQLVAAHAPQQHQQQLLTSPPSVTDVSISMRYVIKLGRKCHHHRH